MPERLLALNYGENWKIPDPSFTFDWGGVSRSYDFLLGNKLDRSLAEVLSNTELVLDGLPALDAQTAAALLAAGEQEPAAPAPWRGPRSGTVVLDPARPERYLEQVAVLARGVEDHGTSLRFVGRMPDDRILARLTPMPETAKPDALLLDGDA